MAATAAQIQAQVELLTKRLELSESHSHKMAEELARTTTAMDTALKEAQANIAEIAQGGYGGGGRQREWDLVDVKSLQPSSFGGRVSESSRQ